MKNLFKNIFEKKKLQAPKTLTPPDLAFDEKTERLYQIKKEDV
mgnify:CR=1 FL=1